MHRRLSTLRSQRPALKRALARHCRAVYRDRRALPGVASAILSERARALIVVVGEVEHALGIPQALRLMSTLLGRLGRWRSAVMQRFR